MPQPLQDADLRYVRVWLLVPLAVVVMAAGVLYSSDSQRRTAQTNFAEARTAQALLSDFLERERAYTDYLATRDPDVFNRYLEEQRRVDAGLGAAEKTSVDDRAEREAVAAQRSVSQQWQTTARVELARVQAGRGPSRAADSYRDALVDRFAAANRNQQARLAEERHGSERRAALVPVWTILALSVLFGERPLPFYVLIPLVGWSRVYLRAHTLLQVVAGVVLALGSTLLFFRIFHVV